VLRLPPRCVAILLGSVAFAGFWGNLGPARADAPPPIVDIWTFGRNRVGQLGTSPPNLTIPWPMYEARHWVSVSAGGEHTLALTAEGEVFAWGSNDSGQLGDGTTQSSMLPVQVQGLTGITLVMAGGAHSLAYRKSDETLWAWGSNATAQLGQPSGVIQSPVPVSVAIPEPLTALDAGSGHNVALGESGAVYTWGENLRGQLGLGDLDQRTALTQVPLAGPAIAVAAGSGHTIAVTAGDGQAWTWGWNVFGALGNGEQGAPDAAFPTPSRALGVTGVDRVSGGDFHSLARTVDGHVFAWGYNTEGQVGNGAHTPANTGVLTPVLLDGIDQVVAIDAGGIHSIALRASGEVWTWGSNQFGGCGTNGRLDELVPTQPIGKPHATSVSAGSKHSVMLVSPRPVARLTMAGDPGTDDEPLTLPLVTGLDGPADVASVAAGFHHGLALDADHFVWSWGDDSQGQLGTADGSHDAPERVNVPLDDAVGIVQIAARASQSFALRSDGVVFSWGDNTYGALGLGSVTAQKAPSRIQGLSRVVAIGAGERHAIALDQDGTVWAWGQNLHGELGTPANATLVRVPAQILGLYGMTAIAAGGYHNAAIDLIGSLVLWGDGSRAQLGTGGIVGSNKVVNAALPLDVTMVSLGRFHSLAVRTGGAVWSFGDGSACQLGTGLISGIWDPMPALVPRAAVVAAGDYHSLSVGYDGKTYAWGEDSRGALGATGPSFSHLGCAPAAMQIECRITRRWGRRVQRPRRSEVASYWQKPVSGCRTAST